MIVWTIYADLITFIVYKDWGMVMAVSVTSLFVFFIEMALHINCTVRVDVKLVTDACEILHHYLKTWFLLDFITWFPIELILFTKRIPGLRDKNLHPVIVYDQNVRYWMLIDLLRIAKILSVTRMKRIASAVSGNPRKPN